MAVDQMVSLGIKCCLIGHSERRGEFGLPTPPESDALLATKCAYILEKGLMCVWCIGEPLPIREKGTEAVSVCVKKVEQKVLEMGRAHDTKFNDLHKDLAGIVWELSKLRADMARWQALSQLGARAKSADIAQ